MEPIRINSDVGPVLEVDYQLTMQAFALGDELHPTTWCESGPPITAEAEVNESYYDAMARDAAKRAGY